MSGENFPIEGFYLESLEGFFFAVKGVVQSPTRVFGVLRYVPHPEGDRIRESVKYKRLYDFQEQERFLKKFPQYLFDDPYLGTRLQCVPRELIKRVFDPKQKLEELKDRPRDKLEEAVLDFASLLQRESGIHWRNLGVSGSLLLSLHLPNSDLDLLVYGEEQARTVYSTLRELMGSSRGELKGLSEEDLTQLYHRRSQEKALPLEAFKKTESGKVLQGRFRGREYFIRLVKEPGEIKEKYGDIKYSTLGKIKIKGRIIDASGGIFTPCLYRIDLVEILQGNRDFIPQEIVSFRGRYCEQTKEGDWVLVRGDLERLEFQDGKIKFRVLLTSKEDFFIPYP